MAYCLKDFRHKNEPFLDLLKKDIQSEKMKPNFLPSGKIPPELLRQIISQAKPKDKRVLLGPGIGLDCAVVESSPSLLVFKSDPITFASDEIGWYAVQVNANDLATTGATPRWFLVTALLPAGKTTPELITEIGSQIQRACEEIGVTVIGGHTEITQGIDRPILAGTMIGEVARESLITPRGARPGDRIFLTKGVPIEATSILAREFPQKLKSILTEDEILRAQDYLYHPGIGVYRDAQTALRAGHISAMHDPTEGGIATALWEIAEASGCRFVVDLQKIIIPELSGRICRFFGLDPLGTIASGALLFTAPAADGEAIRAAFEQTDIPCTEIGSVVSGDSGVVTLHSGRYVSLPRPDRDEIAQAFE
jgi:hydrogenase expression/formation protein HypE